MDCEKLEKILSENNQPKFRLEQIKKAIYQDGVSAFSQISNLPKNLREILDKKLEILPFKVEKILESENKDSLKALFKLRDGNLLESVLISPKPGIWSVCISTQVGCPLNCQFCATGKSGFRRNLTAEEIVGQVLFWKQYLKAQNVERETQNEKNIHNSKFIIHNSHISNVVFMGMGEPFLNWEETKKSLEILNDPKMFNIGSRNISISTSGIPEGIANLAKDFPQVNLALSLHFADDAKRSAWMPINKKYNLEDLRESLQKYFETSKRKVFLEYIMLENINDSLEDAKKLVDYIKSIGKLQLLHVNLIRYNKPVIASEAKQSREDNFEIATSSTTPRNDINSMSPSSGNQTQKFKNFLENNRIQVTIRKSLGDEIQGACGQLSANKQKLVRDEAGK